jgi:hypothetical protein
MPAQPVSATAASNRTKPIEIIMACEAGRISIGGVGGTGLRACRKSGVFGRPVRHRSGTAPHESHVFEPNWVVGDLDGHAVVARGALVLHDPAGIYQGRLPARPAHRRHDRPADSACREGAESSRQRIRSRPGMSVDVHTVWAELERVRREIATLNYSLPTAYPDWQEAATERLREFEEQERDLLQQLAELKRPDTARPAARSAPRKR